MNDQDVALVIDPTDLVGVRGKKEGAKKLRQDIICEHHDSIVAGHPGRYKTQELITRDYWWPRIQGTIRRYIDEYEPCQRTRNH